MDDSSQVLALIHDACERLPGLGPFLAPPRRKDARNGAHRYSVAAFAERAGFVLFLSLETLQFGIAIPRGEELGEARQYPSPKLAATMFLRTHAIEALAE